MLSARVANVSVRLERTLLPWTAGEPIRPAREHRSGSPAASDQHFSGDTIITGQPQDRRRFLSNSLRQGACVGFFTSLSRLTAASAASPNERLRFAVIGTGWRPDIRRVGRGNAIAKQAASLADPVVVCDVDRVAAEYSRDHVLGGKPQLVEDYRDVLGREDVDVVLIGTPDHWHAKMVLEAIDAGKDVYCEKPLTLTVAEGRLICDAVQRTRRIVQVGTQQRTECDDRFLTAVALVQQGRIGKVRRVRIGLEPGESGGPFQPSAPPSHLNWDRWLGPAPQVPYIPQRCHWTFRWWFEYAGGKLTDWGAHHVDIAQWAIGMQDRGPTSIEGSATFPQPLHEGLPTTADSYNTPVTFSVRCQFPDGPEITIDDGPNGILFEGDEGRFFVNRGRLSGEPVEQLAQRPLPGGVIEALVNGQRRGNHLLNFLECVHTREQPISDVFSHHRTITTCHLANICLRLGRKLEWDWQAEQFVGDREADQWLQRQQRSGYEFPV